jgi:ATP synthase mitochondrial F1 complex assembly factor 2
MMPAKTLKNLSFLSKTAFGPKNFRLHRNIHSSSQNAATPLPIGVVGPPPNPPLPTSSRNGDRIERRRKQAELLRQGKEILSTSQDQTGKRNALKKRFWKDAVVKESPGSQSCRTSSMHNLLKTYHTDGYHILLDSRPVRTPNKTILSVPLSKPHLAHAIALEWDLLTSAQQALKSHNIPLTSLTSRADEIQRQDSSHRQQGGAEEVSQTLRNDILQTVMRYLDTDTLLCWVPPSPSHPPSPHTTPSLHDIQRHTAQPILTHLTNHIWPGTKLPPILSETSILPQTQAPPTTKSIIRGWIAGLQAYDLAALERGVLATKSLLIAVRLLVEWSEVFAHLRPTKPTITTTTSSSSSSSSRTRDDGADMDTRFGIEEAAEACSIEVRWQTGRWGEVEDSHDVDREDLRRQLGSVVLMVCGRG